METLTEKNMTMKWNVRLYGHRAYGSWALSARDLRASRLAASLEGFRVLGFGFRVSDLGFRV